jgi:hypothetical protein
MSETIGTTFTLNEAKEPFSEFRRNTLQIMALPYDKIDRRIPALYLEMSRNY